MKTVYYLILVPMVYLAFLVFVVGTIAKLAKIFGIPQKSEHPPNLSAEKPAWFWALADSFLMPSVRRHKPLHWVFLMSFHVSPAAPDHRPSGVVRGVQSVSVYPHEIFLGRGFVGLVLSLTLLFFLFRRFASPVRDLSVPEDYYLLILLFLTVLFGAQMDWARRWYRLRRVGSQRLPDLLHQPAVLQTPGARRRLWHGTFFHAGPACLFCQPVHHPFPLQQGHAFLFNHSHE